MKSRVNILGTSYAIVRLPKESDAMEFCDGYCDTSVHKIVVAEFKPEKGSKENLEAYANKVARHEILHAFMYESGLDCNSLDCECWAQNEEMIDWFAIQHSKIHVAFAEAEVLDVRF